MLIEPDDLVSSISLHNRKDERWIWYNGLPYSPSGPFFWLYNASALIGLVFYEPSIWMIPTYFLPVCMLQALVWLLTKWSCSIRCYIECIDGADVNGSQLIRVKPQPNNGEEELVRLNRRKRASGNKILHFFEFQKVLYFYEEKKNLFVKRKYETSKEVQELYKQNGISSQAELAETMEKFPLNKMEIKLPDFKDLFIERATAPFFVFQVFCVALWCLDEYWYYSLFTLFMLVMFESTLVKQQQRNMSEIRNMGNKGFAIQCYRYNKWTSISSEELLPGDVVSLRSAPKTTAVTRNQSQRQPNQRQQASEPDERLAPCDLVLLSGRVICDESLLTGESVPQVKEGIDQLHMSSTFNENENLVSVINGGTKILQFIPAEKGNLTGAFRPTDKGCPALVVRTGFSTTQGQLLRTILYGSKRVTANNKETGLFIGILLLFAIAASYHLYTEGSKDETKSKFKLLLECTYILTSVVPPELPIQLSLAVNTSLLALHRLGLFCTEPFR
jgi:manganese-transporting P-type ATPase